MSETTSKVREKAREFAQQSANYGTGVAENVQAATSAVAKDVADFNQQWIESVRANINLSLDFYQNLIRVKSPSEFLELTTEHSRKQFEMLTQQAQGLSGLAQKLTTDSLQPMQESVKSAYKQAAA